MIDLQLSDEHEALVSTLGEWGRKDVLPLIHDLDREHRFNRDFLRQMAELQLLGICIPEEWGGAGMDYVSLGLACEELEYVDTHLRVILSVHVGLNSMTLWCWGTAEQKKKYLVPQAKGEKIATYGLTEPNAGSDAVGIQTTAVRKGDRYVLNGEKMWISLADVADHFLVIAWTDQEKKKKRDHSGMSAFIVERGFKGFSSFSIKEKWGILAGNTGGFSMQDVEVPVENRVGEEGEGFKVAMFALENGRYTVASGATGLVRACLDASVAYAQTRKTFGVPIGEHQLVKEMIAQMVSDYDASRLLWLRAGWLKNEGRRNTRETSLAKWFATVASVRAAGDAVQIHGAYGYSRRVPGRRASTATARPRSSTRAARDAQADAGRLCPRLPPGQAPPRRAAGLQGGRQVAPATGRGREAGRLRNPASRGVAPTEPKARRQLPLTGGLRPPVPPGPTGGMIRLSREVPMIPADLPLEFVRVVERAAIAAARTMGQGDRKGSDHVAVEAMRHEMETVDIDGTIVIGEGERDEAPMLYIGEKVGTRQRARGGHRGGSPRGHEPLRHRHPGRDRGPGRGRERGTPPRARHLHGEAGGARRRPRPRGHPGAGRGQPQGHRGGAQP